MRKTRSKANYWFKSFVYFLIIMLMLSSWTIGAAYAELEPSTSSLTDVDADLESPAFDPSLIQQPVFESFHKGQTMGQSTSPMKESVELVDQRTEKEKTFQNPDGTYSKKIFLKPVHVKEKGKWENISPNLEESNDSKVQTKQTKLKTKFEKQAKAGMYATFESNGHILQFGMVGAKGKDKQGKNKHNTPSTANASYEDNQLWYKDVYPKADLRFTTYNSYVKEDIVLHEYMGLSEFSFSLYTDLQLKLQDDGSIDLLDEKNNIVFNLPKPYMSDSNRDKKTDETAVSQDVIYQIKKEKKNKYTLTVIADKNWLQSPERVFPVYIDPTVRIGGTGESEDAYVTSNFPNNNYSMYKGNIVEPNYGPLLKVGKYAYNSGTYNAYIKPVTSNIPENATVHNAAFHVGVAHSYDSTYKRGLWLDRVTADWDAWGITWYSQPSSYNIASAEGIQGEYVTFQSNALTETVQDWVRRPYTSDGFKLHTNGNSEHYWKKIYATDHPYNPPYLDVQYSYSIPKKPQISAHSNGTGSGTGYLNISWNAVPDATEYEVTIFNGYYYETFSAGTATSWSTKGKGIWPTKAEVAEGRFGLHKDGTGSELALDPSPVYRNAFLAESPYGDYSWSHQYWVVVKAKFSDGTSADFEGVRPIIPLEQVARPKGTMQANLPGTNTGYATINWNPVPGATGYKVWIFNGFSYQSFDVGNVTTWSTQGQKIWPTQTEIDAGKYQLHTDKLGSEFPLSPSPIYKNAYLAGSPYGDHSDRPRYWFRVSAYSSNGHPESSVSQAFAAGIPSNSSWLGIQSFWTNIPVIGGVVNASTGNLVISEADMVLTGRGPGVALTRTYNSLDQETGLFGKGWFSSWESYVREEAGDIILVTGSKSELRFKKLSDGSYQAPSGIDLTAAKLSNGWTFTTKDKIETKYQADGRLSHVKDLEHSDNIVTYNYDPTTNRLISVRNASGQVINLQYNGNRVSTIDGPGDAPTTNRRVVKYSYNPDGSGELTSVTSPGGKTHTYKYEGSKLRYVYNPEHTTEKPNWTIYEYDTRNRVRAVGNSLGERTYFSYPSIGIVNVTDPKGYRVRYEYSEAGNPKKIVADMDGLKLTTTYEYISNRLVKVIDPNDQGTNRVSASYTYDGRGNVTSATTALGTVKYQYDANDKVILATDAEGKQTSVTYSGGNAVSSTNYTGEKAGSTAGVTQYDTYGNIKATSSSMTGATNRLQNTGFENDLSSWKLEQGNSSGTLQRDTTQKAPGFGGTASVKLSPRAASSGWGYISATQTVDVYPNMTYTLSGWIKTMSLSGAQAFFNVALFDADGNYVQNAWYDNRYSQVTGTTNWIERQLTFRTDDRARKAIIYLETDYNGYPSGTAWFDKVQLEAGDVSSSYNPLSNSSFETVGSDGFIPNWVKSCSGNCDMGKATFAERIDGLYALQIERKSTTASNVSYRNRVILKQTKSEAVTLTGMAKGENVEHTDPNVKESSDFSVFGTVVYTDGTSKSYQAKFPIGTFDWTRSAVTIPAKSGKFIDYIDVHLLFQNGYTGKVWFDAIRLAEGNALATSKYDADGNYVTSVQDEEGRTISFEYDTNGNKTGETDSKGNNKSYVYTTDHQLEKVTLPNSTSVTYQYDKNGNLTDKWVNADGKRKAVGYEYNGNNQLETYRDAMGYLTSYQYDKNGFPSKTSHPNGNIVEWNYDGAGRLQTVKRNGTEAFSLTYDSNGNLKTVNDSVNAVTKNKTYDEANRMISITERGSTLSWDYYEKTARLKKMNFTQGAYSSTTDYIYNALNLNTVAKFSGQEYRFDYDENGNVRTYTAGNGSGASYQHDRTGKLTALAIGAKNGTTLLSEMYQYDANGNREHIIRQTSSGTATTSYTYDSLNQLKTELAPGKPLKTYTYDGFGNRTNISVTTSWGQPLGSITLTYNDNNQLLTYGSESLTYDKNGNRNTDGAYTYTWNAADQLTSITRKGESTAFATYKYDEQGRRIEKKVSGTVTRYHYLGDSINVLYETDSSSKVLREYVYSASGARLAMKTNGQMLYYHYNGHGDVIAMTDSNNTVVAKYEYDAWGNVLSPDSYVQPIAQGNPFGYAGYMYDSETKLYYLMARYYHPAHGVFLSVDPHPGDANDPITQNGYTYAGNNPVMNVDPNGLKYIDTEGNAYSPATGNIYNDGSAAWTSSGNVSTAKNSSADYYKAEKAVGAAVRQSLCGIGTSQCLGAIVATEMDYLTFNFEYGTGHGYGISFTIDKRGGAYFTFEKIFGAKFDASIRGGFILGDDSNPRNFLEGPAGGGSASAYYTSIAYVTTGTNHALELGGGATSGIGVNGGNTWYLVGFPGPWSKK